MTDKKKPRKDTSRQRDKRAEQRAKEISRQGCVIEYADGRVFRLDDKD